MNETTIKIDLTYLHSLTSGDKSFEQMLLSGTVADIENKVSGLEKAWQGRDPIGIRKNAHSLVSLSAIAGMPQMENWSRLIDQAFMDGLFHPELAVLSNNIIDGWMEAKLQLDELISAY